MYFLSKLIYLLFILHVSLAVPNNPSEWDKQSIAECEDSLKSRSMVTPFPNSKYITVRYSGGIFDGKSDRNGNYDVYKHHFETNNLELPYTSHYVDWISFQNLCKMYQNSKEFVTLAYTPEDNAAVIYGHEIAEYNLAFMVAGMKFNQNPANGNLGTDVDDHPSAPTFIHYGAFQPAGEAGVFFGISKIKTNSGIKQYMAAQAFHRLYLTSPERSYRGYIYPIICMYPSSSNCYKMSQEETELQGNQKADNLFYMTDAFRGYWNIASKPRTREAGAKYCEDNNAGYMLNSSIYELPWSHGKSFRWDLNRINNAYTSILRDQLDLFPFVGFHGREGHEYFFNFNTSLFAGDPQYIFSASFQPALIENLIHDSGFHPTERIVLCYKPFRCAGEQRKRRDVRSQRSTTCKKRRRG